MTSCKGLVWGMSVSLAIVVWAGCTGSGDSYNYDFDGDLVADALDCAPEDSSIYPGATDTYGDGVDQDCDDCADVDGDGSDRDCDGYPANVDPGGADGIEQDCNDSNELVYPGAPETIDGVDANCDGHDGTDADGDGFASVETGGNDCDDTNAQIHVLAPEVCGNGLDDDCSGTAEDADEDFDEYIAEDCGGDDCDDGDPAVNIDFLELCDGVDNDCDGLIDNRDVDGDDHWGCGGDDCDDNDPSTYLGAQELADGRDNNCDGTIDEGTAWADDDGDGYCEGPALCGDGSQPGDCDDTDATVAPDLPEVCGNGLDNDCSGVADDEDLDGDGYYDPACGGLDCNDSDATINPQAPELCGNGVDDDCSGGADDLDEDGDGYVALTCGGPDCDDSNPYVNPVALELADGMDNNCDGSIDEGTPLGDDDGDGFCESANSCSGVNIFPGDCDDTDATSYPGAPEICDGTDNDCDAASDEWDDMDGDGFAPCDGDCDDANTDLSPGAVDLCADQVDSDCDGTADGANCVTCDEEIYDWQGTTIQSAIDAASAGDQICVFPGTYIELLDLAGKAITVVGVAGAATTILDGADNGPVVNFDSGETSATVLEGFTVTHGAALDGAGIKLSGASPTLRSLIVTDNYCDNFGGGMRLDTADPTLDNVTVHDNYAGFYGGGAYISGSDPTLLDVNISQNTAGSEGGGLFLHQAGSVASGLILHGNEGNKGGGAYIGDASSPQWSGVDIRSNVAPRGAGVYIIDSSLDIAGTVAENLATTNAGGIQSQDSDLVIHDAAVWDNIAFGSGGGILVDGGTMTMANTRIVDNLAGVQGGGLYIVNGAVAVLDQVRMTGNECLYSGGAVYLATADAVMTNVIVAGNYSGLGGAGLYLANTDASFENLAIVGNRITDSMSGAGVYVNIGSPTFVNTTISDNYTPHYTGGGVAGTSATPTFSQCNVWANDPDDWYSITDPTGTDGNIGEYANYLTTVDNDAANWDLHLGSATALIDAGDPTLTDPDGSPSDIGAYGGAGAGDWDLDLDGHFEWWQPGHYDPATYPGLDWDCADQDEEVFPGAGC